MKILHYTLGVPPNRSGGLVNYVINLANEQLAEKNEVILLYPSGINPFVRGSYIRKKSSNDNIEHFHLINSLPLAVFGGVKKPADFMTKADSEIYVSFLKMIKPDVIHLHTLMGIHKEFFEVANELDIKLVFTTHDYYGISPNPNFFFNVYDFSEDNSTENWIKASSQSLSTKKLQILQFNNYYKIKKIIKLIKKMNTSEKYIESNLNANFNLINKDEYEKLKRYYEDMFNMISFFHFNSSVAKKVYEINLGSKKIKNSSIVTITNQKNIKTTFKTQKIKSKKIKLGYIGPYQEFKGFFVYKELTRKLNPEKFEFHIFGDESEKINNELLVNHGRYSKKDLTQVYSHIDILIVPSKWKETFGLIVVEALAHGKRVLVSDNVGAKDILPEENIFTSIDSLVSILNSYLNNQDEYLNEIKLKNIKEHCKEVKKIYCEVIDA